MKIKAIALCRVSSPEQVESNSLSRQEINVRDKSEELDCEILKTWSGDVSAKSGKNLNRKDLEEMIEFCKSHKEVKLLIVDEVDRFMRDIEEFYYFTVCFRKIGVRVYFASQPINDDTISSKIQKLLLILQAEMSNNERRTKSVNGLKARYLAGYYPSKVHQGYTKTTIPGLHAPDPIRFPLLQNAFQEVLSRKYTSTEVLKRLNKKDYKTPGGKELDIDKFTRILQGKYYAGIIDVGGSINVENCKGLHKPMISLTEFEELQKIISNRKKKFCRKQHNPLFPLSNLMLCVCGGKLVGFNHRNGKGGVWEKYRCRKCGKQYHKDAIHSALDKRFNEIKMDKRTMKIFTESLNIVWVEEQKENLNYIKQQENNISNLKEKKNQLIRTLAENPDLKDDIREPLDQLKQEIKQAETEIEEANNIEKDLIDFVKFSLNFIYDLKNQWWQLDYEDMARCKELLFPADFYIDYKLEVCTPEISSILRLVCIKKDSELHSESLLVELRGIAPLSKRRIKLTLQVYFDLVFQIRVETEQNNLILSFELA